MSEEKITQCWLFEESFSKAVQVKFDEPHSSSDGGALLLRAADRKLGLTAALAACFPDERQAGKIKHSITDLVCQRVYGLASGYADANDAARLADDPIFKLLLNRSPLSGEQLSSQPTLSRFENSVGGKTTYQLGRELAACVLLRHQQRLRKVWRVRIDLDPTDDPTHGAQQLTFFNGYYNNYCYLPVLGFLTFNDEPDQYLVTAVLRPGNAVAHDGAVMLLRRLVALVRLAFPQALLEVRLDGGFACPEVFDFLDHERRLEYVCGIAKNAVLLRQAEPLMKQARRLARRSKETEQVYGECQYQAGTWDQKRRVVIKAEVVRSAAGELKDNPRFVVTNKRQVAKRVYTRLYCGRGEIENRIKELHHGMEIDRTSCPRFWANQLRVLLTAAAYVLLQEIRLKAQRTSLARAQVSTLREKLLKLAARVEESARRIVVHLPDSFAYRHEWTRVARQLGAAPT